MIVAVEADRDIDLSLFSRFLHQSRIWHRIHESGQKQIVWVNSEADKEQVKSLYLRYANREFTLSENPKKSPVKALAPSLLLVQMARSPLTLTLILANIICFPITFGADQSLYSDWFHAFSFLDFNNFGNYLIFASLSHNVETGEYWRFLTPMLLHFGWLHLVFNLLWVWEIGRRIEQQNGGIALLRIVALTSMGANFLQFLMYGEGLFGGMSGVVFGLLGYSLVWSALVPERTTGLRKGIYIFMLAYLGLGFIGVVDLIQLGNLANGAHLGGLLVGLLLGGIDAGITKLRRLLA